MSSLIHTTFRFLFKGGKRNLNKTNMQRLEWPI